MPSTNTSDYSTLESFQVDPRISFYPLIARFPAPLVIGISFLSLSFFHLFPRNQTELSIYINNGWGEILLISGWRAPTISTVYFRQLGEKTEKHFH